jgi:carbon monoxide dehydrogenase subunit G
MQLSFKINKSADFIFDYLTDMQKYVSVHPVITKINKTGNDSYLVYETLKVGFIPFSFTYPVSIESKPLDKVVIMRATVMKFTKIEMTFVLKADSGFTVVEENLQFKSPLPVKSIMQSIFKKQHGQLFKNIENQF